LNGIQEEDAMLKQLLIPILATLQLIAVGAIREQDKDNKQALVRFMGVELRARPYEGKEYDKAPVDILDLKMERAKYGLKVSGIEIVNRSPKPIKAVDFIWFLTREEGGSRVILHKGFISGAWRLPKAIAKDERVKLESASVEIDKMFLNRIGDRGQYYIEIAVDNVGYVDGKSEKPVVRAWRL
jgi:hypothetical protein